MATSIKSVMTEGNKKTVVRYNSEYKEFIVQFYIDNIWESKADYYTDDRQDALKTAHKFLDTQYYRECEQYQKDCTRFFAPLDEIVEAIENFEGIAGLSYTELLSMINQSTELKAAVNAQLADRDSIIIGIG